jgi:hypothetical protein
VATRARTWHLTAMYRVASPPEPDVAPAAELLYAPVGRARESSVVAMFKLFSFPALVALVLATLSSPTVGLAAMVATAGLMLWRWRRAPHDHDVVLRVERGQVCLLAPGSRVTRATLPLDDLLDVTMDTRTITPVEEGDSAIPALRFAAARIGPEVDTARIVLVGRGGSTPLTEAYLPKMDTTEWFGKLRVFLRRSGWVPEDERGGT